jgi:antitoxin component of RelBE/YafQ-DinJ toxin-antitoxin module
MLNKIVKVRISNERFNDFKKLSDIVGINISNYIRILICKEINANKTLLKNTKTVNIKESAR